MNITTPLFFYCALVQRCPPSYVSDLFSDLKDGSQLLDLLEVMSGQPMVSASGISELPII